MSEKETEDEVGRESCSFYVTNVPPIVFDTDPEASIKVRASIRISHTQGVWLASNELSYPRLSLNATLFAISL